jgi:hypothetical protein
VGALHRALGLVGRGRGGLLLGLAAAARRHQRRGREGDEGAGQLNVTDALLPPVQVVVEAPTQDIV